MQMNASAFPTTVTPAQPSLNRTPSHAPVHEAAQQNPEKDRVKASATIASTAMNFDISVGSNAIVVTLSDRVSGEVLRKLVYDHGGSRKSGAHGSLGHLIDIAT